VLKNICYVESLQQFRVKSKAYDTAFLPGCPRQMLSQMVCNDDINSM